MIDIRTVRAVAVALSIEEITLSKWGCGERGRLAVLERSNKVHLTAAERAELLHLRSQVVEQEGEPGQSQHGLYSDEVNGIAGVNPRLFKVRTTVADLNVAYSRAWCSATSTKGVRSRVELVPP